MNKIIGNKAQLKRLLVGIVIIVSTFSLSILLDIHQVGAYHTGFLTGLMVAAILIGVGDGTDETETEPETLKSFRDRLVEQIDIEEGLAAEAEPYKHLDNGLQCTVHYQRAATLRKVLTRFDRAADDKPEAD